MKERTLKEAKDTKQPVEREGQVEWNVLMRASLGNCFDRRISGFAKPLAEDRTRSRN